MESHSKNTTPGRISDLRGSSPLLPMFTIALLVVVATLVLLAATPTWAMVGVAVSAVVVMTGWVLIAIQRLLDA